MIVAIVIGCQFSCCAFDIEKNAHILSYHEVIKSASILNDIFVDQTIAARGRPTVGTEGAKRTM